MDFGDNVRARLGAGDDLQLGHDGNDSFVSNYTGDYYLNQFADDKDIILRCDDGGGGITPYLTLDGSAAKMVADKSMLFKDSQALQVGDAGDATFFHNGTYTNLANSTGDFYIDQNTDDGDIIFRNDNGSGGLTNYMVIDGGATAIDLLQDTRLKAGKKLFLDGGGNSYIQEESADNLIFRAGWW